MRITGIKKNNKKLTDKQLLSLVSKLQKAINKKGFEASVAKLNGSSINISGHGRSFSVNTDKLGYNARINRFTIEKSKKGYVRTNVPTWTQRQQFNHVINDTLDTFGVSAKIVSGEYVVRHYEGRVNGWDLPEPYHNGYGLQVQSVLEIVPLNKAEEAVEWYGINAPFVAVGE